MSSRKTQTGDRLSRLAVLDGVLPTPPRRSRSLARMAADVLSGADGAEAAAPDWLTERVSDPEARSAAPVLAASDTMRSQVAAFAAAGIGMVMTGPETWRAGAEGRRARGLSPAVSRVFLDSERILLETPRILVRFEEGTERAERDAVFDRTRITPIDGRGGPHGARRCAVLQGSAVETCLALLEEPSVVYAEPDFIEQIGHRYGPGDPEFASQWQHGALRSEAAWDVATGRGVRLAVIDNGFHAGHPDLVFGPWSGWFHPTPDFLDYDFVPGLVGMPDEDHGTGCAGMAGARASNGNGGIGVAFESDMQMIACLADQIGTQSTLASAVAYAAEPSVVNAALGPGGGADVITCSLGPNGATWRMQNVLQDAIEFAARTGRGGLGTPIFWAVSNGNHPVQTDEVCSHPDVVAIGRSRPDDGDDGSGFGPELDMLAPGVNVRIAASGGFYADRTGTSFAAPCAAAVAALVLEVAPDLTAAEVLAVLADSCDKVGPLPYIDGRNARFGHGRVNAEAAVRRAETLVQIG